jgi:hypothetical protein
MTTGTSTRDFRTTYNLRITYPDGSSTSNGTAQFGGYYSKTWSGSNYPPTRPVYEVIKHVDRNGRVLKYRRRVDVRTRRKTEDHPYSCSIFESRNEIAYRTDWYYGYDWDLPGPRWFYEKQTQFSIAGWPYSATDPWNSNDDIALLGKLREQIAGSDFNLGVFLGESQEALRMIFDSATRIRKSILAVKRGNLRAAASHLLINKPKRINPKGKTASAIWLELQYGWLPLLQDAEGAAQFLAKYLEFPMVRTYKVRKKKNHKWSNGGSTNVSQIYKASSQKQIIARVSEVNVPSLVGLTDPASVAWELLPFSFVADWFIPIGNYLAARSLASAVTGSFVTTMTTKSEGSFGPPLSVSNTSVRNIWSGGFHSEKRIAVDRSISTSLAVPMPRVKPLGDVPSWKRAANAVSLLVQLGPKLLS